MWGVGMESGRFEEIERPWRRLGRCPGGQAEMSENPGDHSGIFNGGDDLQGAVAAMVVFSEVGTRPSLK